MTSEAVTMDQAEELLAENGVSSSYDESAGQQYAQWTDSQGRLCQIWLEDENSVAARASLVSEYDLGGIAAWVLGNEQDFRMGNHLREYTVEQKRISTCAL